MIFFDLFLERRWSSRTWVVICRQKAVVDGAWNHVVLGLLDHRAEGTTWVSCRGLFHVGSLSGKELKDRLFDLVIVTVRHRVCVARHSLVI